MWRSPGPGWVDWSGLVIYSGFSGWHNPQDEFFEKGVHLNHQTWGPKRATYSDGPLYCLSLFPVLPGDGDPKTRRPERPTSPPETGRPADR